MPFTAKENDPECDYSKDIFNRCQLNEFGAVGAYAPVMATHQAILEGQRKKMLEVATMATLAESMESSLYTGAEMQEVQNFIAQLKPLGLSGVTIDQVSFPSIPACLRHLL